MKAKDLRGKNIEEIDNESPEEDAVAAAYENISKRLDSIRSGKSDDDSGDEEMKKPELDEEPELEEWKGPKPPAKTPEIEVEEEELDIRKVKLHNLEDKEEKPAKDEEFDDLEDEDEQEEEKVDEKDSFKDEEPQKMKKDWEPAENDPLDDEELEDELEVPDKKSFKEDQDQDNEERFEERDVKVNGREEDSADTEEQSFDSEIKTREVSEPADMPEDIDEEMKKPDTLDDLTGGVLPRRNMDDFEDDDYTIPSLKGSRQEGSDLSYNTHPQREGIGQSYSPKGNYMEGNDPNNFFSSHQQPQAPKRANKFHLLVLVLIGIAVIGFTVYILKGGFGDISIGTAKPSPSPSVAATPEPTPTPTPEPEVERGNFTVKVLNGTTTSGLAGKIRDKLKELGYKTATPGNNSDTDIDQTEIRVKEGTQSATLFERLKLDLAPDYEAKKGEDLDSKSANDAEVIIGAK